MSWIKEAFDGLGNSKDPFVKILFRLALLVLFILLAFLTFSIISGKKILFSNGTIQVINVSSNNDSLSTQTSSKETQSKKTEIVRVASPDTIEHANSRADKTTEKSINLSKEAANGQHATTTIKRPGIANEKNTDPGMLTAIDKQWIDKAIDTFIGKTYSRQGLPIGVGYISESNSVRLAYQLKSYLESEGFFVKDMTETDILNFKPGISMGMSTVDPLPESFVRIAIDIGALNTSRRQYNYH